MLRLLKDTVWAITLIPALLIIGPEIARAQIINAAFTTNPPQLDPLMTSTTAARQVTIYLWETLVTVGEGYEVTPQLAESWEVSNDKLTYTFKIRQGVKFHNGDVMDAEDVASSFIRAQVHSIRKGRLEDVESIKAIGSDTVRFKLNREIPFLAGISMPLPFIAVMPKEINDKYGKNPVKPSDMVGTGPFRLLEWTPDVHLRLGKFEEYATDNRFDGPTGFAGKRTVHVDEVRFIPVTEPASRLAGIETGEFDFIESAPVNSFAHLDQHAQIDPIILKPKWAIVLRLNHRSPWTKKLPFRKALVHALNMEDVLKAVTQGRREFYRVQPSIFFPEQKDFYTTAGSEGFYNNQDLAKVRQLLDEAGYNNEEITYVTNRDFDWMYKASLSIASQLTKAGFNIKLEFFDWPSQRQVIAKPEGWDFAQDGWSPRFDPIMLNGLRQPDRKETAFYSNPEMTRLFIEMNQGVPQEQRRKTWEKIQRLIWEDVYMIRAGDYFEIDAIRKSLSGYRPFYVTPRFWDVRK